MTHDHQNIEQSFWNSEPTLPLTSVYCRGVSAQRVFIYLVQSDFYARYAQDIYDAI